MRKKPDGSINMGRIDNAENEFMHAMGDENSAELDDPVISRISHIANGMRMVTRFVLDNEEHYEYAEQSREMIEFIKHEVSDLKKELKEIKQMLHESR